MTRPSVDSWGLMVAAAVSTRAECTRRKVGAVLVNQAGRVIATGYNGAPAGRPSCLDGACPRGQLSYEQMPADAPYTNCIAIHAELNALLHATRDTPGSTLYITDEPCHECRRSIAAAGVARVVTPNGEHTP